MRIDVKIEMGHQPECTKHIIGISRTVTEAYESPRLLADLRRQNGMVKTRHFDPSNNEDDYFNYFYLYFLKLSIFYKNKNDIMIFLLLTFLLL